MAQRPVAHLGVDGQQRHELVRHSRRSEQVVKLEPHAGHRVAKPIELLGIGQMDQRESAVELEHADLEHPYDAKALHARKRTRRRDGALRRDDDDAVSHAGSERARKLRPEHDAEAVRLEIGKRARAHVAAEIGDGILERGIDAAHQCAAIDFSRR